MITIEDTNLTRHTIDESSKSSAHIKIWCKLIYKSVQHLNTFSHAFLFWTYIFEITQLLALTFHSVVLFYVFIKIGTASSQRLFRFLFARSHN